MLLSLDAQGNPLQQGQSKEPRAELQHQQPTLDGHLWVSLSTNSLDFPTTTAVHILDKKREPERGENHIQREMYIE